MGATRKSWFGIRLTPLLMHSNSSNPLFPNPFRERDEQLAILQQQLENELYQSLQGTFFWGFNRAIRSVADPQSLSLPSSFSHLEERRFLAYL